VSAAALLWVFLSDVMIRCDDWYHPGCVKLPESDIELIDQFICPLCVTSESASVFI
jgi:hypothetical protein